MPEIAPILVTLDEAAAALRVSRDFFDEHIRHDLRLVRKGSRMIRVSAKEVERWVAENEFRVRDDVDG